MPDDKHIDENQVVTPLHVHNIQITHEDNKGYKCESCGQSFSRSERLKKHIHTIHEGYKDYKCNFCGTSFSQAPNLKKHNRAFHNKK